MSVVRDFEVTSCAFLTATTQRFSLCCHHRLGTRHFFAATYLADLLDYNMADVEISEAGPSVPTGPQPRQVVYCAVCTFPPEYCEFGPSPSKCRNWLHKHQPELYAKLWSDEAISSNLANLTTKQAEDLEREAAKKERKTVAKEERARAEMAASRIVLKKEARTKRKVTTSIVGLHLFSPPLPALKVVAKA